MTDLQNARVEIAELLERRLREVESELALAAVEEHSQFVSLFGLAREVLTEGSYPK